MLKIDTIRNHERMSTQDLLLEIEAAVKAGETEFDIAASGQHNIGGAQKIVDSVLAFGLELRKLMAR